MIEETLKPKGKIKKEQSARKFMVYCFSITYCLGHFGNVVLAFMGKISVETYIALWSGFTPLMLLIAEWYFKREDRQTQPTGGAK